MFQSETPGYPKLRNEKPVLFSEERVGEFTLARVQINRPQVLNALDTQSYEMLEPRLLEWARDANIAAVVFEATGDKAFCAGGDVKTLVQEIRANGLEVAKNFFTREYFVDHMIHTYPKPIVALADGITMGGGLGLIYGASHKVVTERTVMAMPEIAIGLFPDVGATGFLSRLPDHFGLFLGLTGARITGADAVASGLADHFVPSSAKRRLNADLLRLQWNKNVDRNREVVSKYLDQVSAEPPRPENFHAYLEEAVGLFMNGSYEQITAEFGAAEFKSAFLQDAQARFRNGSPTSKQVFYRAYQRHRGKQMKDVFIAEWDMAIQFSQENEFFEGVRAILIDKDGKPKWNPEVESEVKNIERFFASPDRNNLAEKLAQFSW